MTDIADVLSLLEEPFPFEDHEFRVERNKRNNTESTMPFLTEEAITRRLDKADPAWVFHITSVSRNGEQAVVVAELSVCGIWRSCVGMQRIDDAFGEAEKGAATDALKRGGRLFGIGRYLLGSPSGIGKGKDQYKAEFARWLSGDSPVDRVKQNLGQGQNRRIPAPAPASAPQNAPAPLNVVKKANVVAAVQLEKGKGAGKFNYVLLGIDNGFVTKLFEGRMLRELGYPVDDWKADSAQRAKRYDLNPMLQCEFQPDGSFVLSHLNPEGATP